MSKRFTETMKWDDTWYRKLSPQMKCLWQFICDRCDNAGYWKVDLDAAGFYIGLAFNPDVDYLIPLNDGKARVSLEGEYWHILDFVHFQYKELVDNNPLHHSVKQLIEKHLRGNQGAGKGYQYPIGKGKGKGIGSSYGLSNRLLQAILNRNPNHKKPDIVSWDKHIDLMIRIDKRDPKEIERVIDWCQTDPFWQNNILSTEKLRKQYDQLILKMGKSKPIDNCPKL